MIRRLPPLNTLRAFEVAARHGSFLAAARELSVTAGAVSRPVRLLEDCLGLVLFGRLPQAVELTDLRARPCPSWRRACPPGRGGRVAAGQQDGFGA